MAVVSRRRALRVVEHRDGREHPRRVEVELGPEDGIEGGALASVEVNSDADGGMTVTISRQAADFAYAEAPWPKIRVIV